MGRHNVYLVVACLVLAVAAGNICAAEHAIAMDAELKLASEFNWRGRTITRDWCVQPGFTAGYRNFSANIWGSWALSSDDSDLPDSRLDGTLEYRYTYESHIIRPGVTAFIYPGSEEAIVDDTYECFLGYTYDVFLLPTVVVYYDFGDIDGFFTSFSVAHSCEVVKNRAAVDLKFQVDMADKNYNNVLFSYPPVQPDGLARVPGDGSAVDAALSVALPVSVMKNGVLTPAVKAIRILDSTVRDFMNERTTNEDTTTFVYSLAFNMWF